MAAIARRAALFALCAVIGGALGLVLHEVVGHALLAWSFGAKDVRITLNPDFTGEVGGSLETLSQWQLHAVDAGGIVVNLVTGALALAFAHRMGRARLLFILFGAIGLYKALEYATMSFYYGGTGDPLEHAPMCTLWHPKGYWAIPLALLPLAMFACGRAFMRTERSLATAILVAAPTIVLGGAFYYRGSVFGDGIRRTAQHTEARAALCGRDAKIPFPMLPVVALVAGGGALAGAWSIARRLTAS